ncbi:MAG: carbohydrate ABC transporter permease [Thermoprotei archaeon]|nr:MAG: carbohydrate ABC transporter permease [Thermoprotei archaeon]
MIYIVLILLSLPVIIPYAWLVIGAFAADLRGVIPTGFTLSNWKFLIEPIQVPGAGVKYPDIWLVTFNTLFIAVATTVLTVFLSAFGGYALSRVKFAGRGLFLALTMVLRAFPGIALLVALFYVINMFRLYGNPWSVILSKTALMLPLGLWVMKGFFDTISWEIEMAALVDGLSRIKTFFKIMLPLVRPGLAALSILAFIYGWSEYILVVVFLPTEKSWTLTMYLQRLAYQAFAGEVSVAGITRPMIIAVGLWYMIPIILFFIFAQKYLLRVAVGGVKGV